MMGWAKNMSKGLSIWTHTVKVGWGKGACMVD